MAVDNELILFEIGYLTPKNSFLKTKNIIGLHLNNLEDTVNIHDICLINLGKIGEWIGYGGGPLVVPKTEDNRSPNVIFVKYNNTKPYAYNIHCLYKLINNESNTLLMPHINKHIDAAKFIEIYSGKDEFKILRLNGNDMVI